MNKKKALRVTGLEVKNYMGIKAINIKPGPGVVKIEGPNGAGKSSVINGLWEMICGADESPPMPIRKGQKEAKLKATLGDIVIYLRHTAAGKYLEVKDNGLKCPSPQTMLNTLFTKVSMDPQAFIDMRPARRRELLLDLTGARAELEVLEGKQTDAYNERTLVNREIKTLEGKLVGAPLDEKIEERSVQEIMQKAQEAERHNRAIGSLVDQISRAKKESQDFERNIANLAKRIAELEYNNSNSIKLCKNLEKELAGMVPIDVSGFEVEITSAEEHNERVRAVAAANVLREELAGKQALSDKFTDEIESIQSARRDILNQTALPVKNLTVEGDNTIIDGKPFDNLSTTEQFRVAMEIGMALNPTLRVLRISRGPELDAKSMAEVYRFADEKDCQIWIEYVTEKSQGGFFIKDGELQNADNCETS